MICVGGVRLKFSRIASLFTKNCLSCAIGKSSASGSQDVHSREDESQTPTASKAGKETLLETLGARPLKAVEISIRGLVI